MGLQGAVHPYDRRSSTERTPWEAYGPEVAQPCQLSRRCRFESCRYQPAPTFSALLVGVEITILSCATPVGGIPNAPASKGMNLDKGQKVTSSVQSRFDSCRLHLLKACSDSRYSEKPEVAGRKMGHDTQLCCAGMTVLAPCDKEM